MCNVQETLAFVDCLVNDKPAPCSGEDGLIALVMAIAAGKSAEEKRWVKMAEIVPDLFEAISDSEVNDSLPEGDAEKDKLLTPSSNSDTALEESGAINWSVLFEKTFAPVFVPPREAQRRPDLKAANFLFRKTEK